MNYNFGQLIVSLQEAQVDRIDFLVDKINQTIRPAVKLTRDDVYIRAMYIVNEEINSYGGKFSAEELNSISELLIDAPVMVGHRKDKLPIARNFHAEIVEKDSQRWVKTYFYWLKNIEQADDLKKNLDGGIYKECSIGFTYHYPECSVCAKDIRTCPHEPFTVYMQNSDSQPCFYYYRQVDKVLETSLVFRGAVANTSISNELSAGLSLEPPTPEPPQIIDTLSELPPGDIFLITPHYEGLDVMVSGKNNKYQVLQPNNQLLPKGFTKKLFKQVHISIHDNYARLVGYRGKQRCTESELKDYLAGNKSPVSRIELFLFPTEDLIKQKQQLSRTLHLKLLRTRLCNRQNLDQTAGTLKTKDGIRIWSFPAIPPSDAGYICSLADNQNLSSYYSLNVFGDKTAQLDLYSKGFLRSFSLSDFSQKLFLENRWFIATQNLNRPQIDKSNLICRMEADIAENKNGITVSTKGGDTIILQPVKLNGNKTYCCYKRD